MKICFSLISAYKKQKPGFVVNRQYDLKEVAVMRKKRCFVRGLNLKFKYNC